MNKLIKIIFSFLLVFTLTITSISASPSSQLYATIVPGSSGSTLTIKNDDGTLTQRELETDIQLIIRIQNTEYHDVTDEIISQIRAVNASKNISELPNFPMNLNGYRLTAELIFEIFIEHIESKNILVGKNIPITLHVPSLPTNTSDVIMGHYDKELHIWEALPASFDTNNKTVSVVFPTLSPVFIAYKTTEEQQIPEINTPEQGESTQPNVGIYHNLSFLSIGLLAISASLIVLKKNSD